MKKILALTLMFLFTAALIPQGVPAGELAGVTMDNTIQIGGRTAALAGMGIRTKTFLKVKVYVAGLYMETPSKDPGNIIASDQAKAMEMAYLYKKVDGEKLQEAWREGFEANTPAATPDLKNRMDRFVSLFSEAAVEGDRHVFQYEPGKGTTIIFNGQPKATIEGSDFASALLAIWFGEKLGDGGLKELKRSILEGM